MLYSWKDGRGEEEDKWLAKKTEKGKWSVSTHFRPPEYG
jgi:hypothetical protein